MIPTFVQPVSTTNVNNHPSCIMLEQHRNLDNQQTFHVYYNGSSFKVNPISLSQASNKFNKLIQPYIQNPEEMLFVHLEIRGGQFKKRNVENFLKICQKLPTDVKNSEMEEICEIAKLFQATDIYCTGIAFVKSNIDPNFCVPDDKYSGPNRQAYLIIEGQKNAMDTDSDLSDTDLKDIDDSKFHGNYYQMNENKNNNSAEKIINSKKASPTKDKHHKPKKAKTNVLYTIKLPNHVIKCPTFKFYRNGQILFSAKQKDNDIFFAEGEEVHVSQKETHLAHINQHMMTNTIYTKMSRFNLKYVKTGRRYSIEAYFPLDDKMTLFGTRKPKYDPKKEKQSINYNGEYHHKPLPSARNIILEDKDGKAAFITRKMSDTTYEVECLPTVEPLVAFCLGVSDIVGPFCVEE